MNTSQLFHTPAPETQESPRNTHSRARKFSAAMGVTAMLNATVPATVSPSVVHLMDDTVGKAMTFVPPSPKTEANISASRTILVKYTVQPGDTLGTLACVFGVTVENFMKYNPQITHKDRIYVGDTLIVPNPSRNIAKCVVDVRGETKNMGDLKEKRTPIVGSQEPLSPEDFKKAFLANQKNIVLLAKYMKLHYPKEFQEIKIAHVSKIERQKRLFDLYTKHQNDIEAQTYVQEIRNSDPDKQITEGAETILMDAGYTASAKDFLQAKMWMESSGGRSLEVIAEAQKLMKLYNEATLPKVKERFEKKIADSIQTAISWIVGSHNDIGPYGMRPGWVRAEQLNGWKSDTELKLVDDVGILRQGVKKIFISAVKENLSQKEIMDRLIELDSRFDAQLMGEAALFSFQRISSNLKEQGLTSEQAVKGANIDYNRGEGTTKKIMQKKGNIVSTKYSDKMDTTLKLMTAFSTPQAKMNTQEISSKKIKNKSVVSVKHGIDHTKVQSAPAKKSKTGTTLCSRTAHDNLRELGVEQDKILRGDARHIVRNLRKTDKAKLFHSPEKLKQFFLAQAAHGNVVWDVYANSRRGHRMVAFIGKDGKPYILDPYYSDGVSKKKTSPKLLDDYMCHNFARHFSKMIVNTNLRVNNEVIKVATKQEKQPTPMPIIMANVPADNIPFMVQSEGVLKLSQGVSTSVVKLTDTVARDNHLHTAIDMGNDKMLFPALSSARIRNRINLVRVQIEILTSNITDPVVKKRIEKKLGQNPAWTMAQNIKLQKKRYVKGGDIQALKNAKGLYDLLMMCEQEIAKMPAFNKMAA